MNDKRKVAEEVVHESEKRFRNLMEQSPLGIAIFTPEGQITQVNNAWFQLWGVNEEEAAQIISRYNLLTDKQIVDLGVAPLIRKAFDGESVVLPPIEYSGQRTVEEIGLEDLKANSAWIQGHFFPVKNENQEIEFVVNTNVDITNLKQAEDKLRYQSTLLENISDAVISHDLDYKIVSWNQTAQKIFGWKAEEVIGRSMREVFRTENADIKREEMLASIDDKGFWNDEVTQIRKDGERVHIQSIVSRITNDQGNAVGFVGVARDITDRKQAEEVLHQSVEKYRGIFDESIVTIYVFDEKKHFIDSNQAGLNLLGYSRDELLSMSISDVDANPVVVLPAHKQLLSGENIVNYEHQLRRKDGTIITVLNNSISLTDSEGNIIGMQSTLIDITEHKRAEEDLRQLREELLHATRVGTIAELTAALAHEINHPLGSILNNANAAKRFLENEKPDLDEIREIIADIISEDKRANDVIQKLKDLMKKTESKYIPLKINVIIEEVLSLAHSELIIEDISLSQQFEKNLPKVKADRIQLQQVLLNLIVNAVDAMKESKVKNLSISTSKKDSQNIIVCMVDSGEGIDKNKKDNLFKPFFTTKKKGIGMGLSINKTIIKAFGGDIWAENNKDGGASFFITLPIYKEKSS